MIRLHIYDSHPHTHIQTPEKSAKMKDEGRKQKSESIAKHSATLMLFIVCLFSVPVSNFPFALSHGFAFCCCRCRCCCCCCFHRAFFPFGFSFSLTFAIRSSNKSYYSLLLTPVQCFFWFCFVLLCPVWDASFHIIFLFVCHFLGSQRLYRISTI